MIKERTNGLCISPIKNYTTPNIPTFGAARDNPALLKRLPNRWRRNAAVLACVGMVGVFSLSSCGRSSYAPMNVYNEQVQNKNGNEEEPFAPYNDYDRDYYVNYPYDGEPEHDFTIRETLVSHDGFDLSLRVHGGGGGAGPFYIIHLTEQEAIGIIRSKLESAGLDFFAPPTEEAIEASKIVIPLWRPWMPSDARPAVSARLVLFDEDKKVFVGFINDDLGTIERIKREFSELTSPSSWVFKNSGWMAFDTWGIDDEHYRLPSEEQMAEAVPLLIDHLTFQVERFIELLQSQGII